MSAQVDASDISLIILKYLVEKNYVGSGRSFCLEEQLLQEILPPKYFPQAGQSDDEFISQLKKFTSFMGNLGNLQDVLSDYIGARELVKLLISKSVLEWKIIPTESVNLIDGLCTNLKALGKCLDALKTSHLLALPAPPDPSRLSIPPIVLNTGTNTDEPIPTQILPILPETKDAITQTEDVETQSEIIEIPSTSSNPFSFNFTTFSEVSQSSLSQHDVYVEHQQVIPSAIMNNLLTNTQLQEKIADNINQRENPQFTILSPDEVEQLFCEIMKNCDGPTNLDTLCTDSNMISTESNSFSNLLTITNDFQTSSLDVLEMLSTPVKTMPADSLTFKLPSARKTPTRLREKSQIAILPSQPVASRWESLGRRSIAPKIPVGARAGTSTSLIHQPTAPVIKTPNKRKARMTTPVKITPEKAKENSFFHLVTPNKTPNKNKGPSAIPSTSFVPSTSSSVTKTVESFLSQLGLGPVISELTPTDEIERITLQPPSLEMPSLSKISLLFSDTPEPKNKDRAEEPIEDFANESLKTPGPSTPPNPPDFLSKEKHTPLLARLISSASRIRSHTEMVAIEKKSRSTPRKKHVRSLNFGTPKPKCKPLNLNLSTVEEEINERKRRLSNPAAQPPAKRSRKSLGFKDSEDSFHIPPYSAPQILQIELPVEPPMPIIPIQPINLLTIAPSVPTVNPAEPTHQAPASAPTPSQKLEEKKKPRQRKKITDILPPTQIIVDDKMNENLNNSFKNAVESAMISTKLTLSKNTNVKKKPKPKIPPKDSKKPNEKEREKEKEKPNEKEKEKEKPNSNVRKINESRRPSDDRKNEPQTRGRPTSTKKEKERERERHSSDENKTRNYPSHQRDTRSSRNHSNNRTTGRDRDSKSDSRTDSRSENRTDIRTDSHSRRNDNSHQNSRNSYKSSDRNYNRNHKSPERPTTKETKESSTPKSQIPKNDQNPHRRSSDEKEIVTSTPIENRKDAARKALLSLRNSSRISPLAINEIKEVSIQTPKNSSPSTEIQNKNRLSTSSTSSSSSSSKNSSTSSSSSSSSSKNSSSGSITLATPPNGSSIEKRSGDRKKNSNLLSQIFGSPISSSGSSVGSPPKKKKSYRRITPLRIIGHSPPCNSPNPFENPVEVYQQPSNISISTVSATPSLPPRLKAPMKRILPTPVETSNETCHIFAAKRKSPERTERSNSKKKEKNEESEKKKSHKANSHLEQRLSLLRGEDVSNISDNFWTPVKNEKERNFPLTPRVVLTQPNESSDSLEEGEIRLHYEVPEASSCTIDGPPITPGRRSPTSSLSNFKALFESDMRVLKEQSFNGILSAKECAKEETSSQCQSRSETNKKSDEGSDPSREYNFQVGGKNKVLTFTEHESVIGLLEMSKSPKRPSSPRMEMEEESNQERKKALAICSTIDMNDFQEFITSKMYPQ